MRLVQKLGQVSGTMANDVPQQWKEFADKDEEQVRKELYQGLYGSTKEIAAKGYLKHKQEERARREAHP